MQAKLLRMAWIEILKIDSIDMHEINPTIRNSVLDHDKINSMHAKKHLHHHPQEKWSWAAREPRHFEPQRGLFNRNVTKLNHIYIYIYIYILYTCLMTESND